MVDCRRAGDERSTNKEEPACPRRVGPGAGGGRGRITISLWRGS